MITKYNGDRGLLDMERVAGKKLWLDINKTTKCDDVNATSEITIYMNI